MKKEDAEALGLTDDLLQLDEDDPRVVEALGDARWPNQAPPVDGVTPTDQVPQNPDAVQLDDVDEED